jgi:hypothetical protein
MPLPDDLQQIKDSVDATPIWNKDTPYLMIEDKWVGLANAFKGAMTQMITWLANALPTMIANISHPIGSVMIRYDNIDPSTLYNGQTWQLIPAGYVLYSGTPTDGDWKYGTLKGSQTLSIPLLQHTHELYDHTHITKTASSSVTFKRENTHPDAWEPVIIPPTILADGKVTYPYGQYCMNWDYLPALGTSGMKGMGAANITVGGKNYFVDGRDQAPGADGNSNPGKVGWGYPFANMRTKANGDINPRVNNLPRGICVVAWRRIS